MGQVLPTMAVLIAMARATISLSAKNESGFNICRSRGVNSISGL